MLIPLLRRRLRPYRRPIAIAAVCQVVEILTLLLLPTLNAEVVNRGILDGDRAAVWQYAGLMVLVTGVALVAGVGTVAFGARAALGLGRDLRAAVYHHALKLSPRQVFTLGPAALTTRTTNDVAQIERLVIATFTTLTAAPLTAIAAVGLALHQDVPLSSVPLVLVVVTVVIAWAVLVRMGGLYARIQPGVERLNRILGEQISGVSVVRAFVRDRHEQERFRRTNRDLRALSFGVGKLNAFMFPAVALMSNLATVVIVWAGAIRVDAGAVRIGTVNAFIDYLVYLIWSILLTTFVLASIPRAAVSARRLSEVLDTAPEVPPPVAPMRGRQRGLLEIRDGGYRYPGASEPALSGVDVTVQPGETVAVIGMTGSGKSTLLAVAARLLDPTTGRVRLNGVDARELDGPELRLSVGLVPQRPCLFAGTVAGNLRLARTHATDDELWEALEIAQAAEFVRELGGLDAVVAPGGGTFSGGQRQRLTIARTIVRRPDIYLFDDCFSALDPATERALRTALAEHTRLAAVLLVAQRVTSIRDADRIVVLDGGRVAGAGRHDDLLASNRAYQEIVQSQPIQAMAG
ncbi:MAG: ABC transporter ATP-binding protein [Actinomycetota bacterium]|nr:ABC transporter ATP-binding protein [Actinomycetota bacterium]